MIEEIKEIGAWLVIGIGFLVAFFVGRLIVEKVKKWQVGILIATSYILLAVSMEKNLPTVLNYAIWFLFGISGACILYILLEKLK